MNNREVPKGSAYPVAHARGAQAPEHMLQRKQNWMYGKTKLSLRLSDSLLYVDFIFSTFTSNYTLGREAPQGLLFQSTHTKNISSQLRREMWHILTLCPQRLDVSLYENQMMFKVSVAEHSNQNWVMTKTLSKCRENKDDRSHLRRK